MGIHAECFSQSLVHSFLLTFPLHLPHGALPDQLCPILAAPQSLGPIIPSFSWRNIDSLAVIWLMLHWHF